MVVQDSLNYFLISVSNRRNLELCIKHALAGFTNSVNGFWAFLDIEIGDYVSFLYGARAKNLYRVVGKAAYRDAENLPPWDPITFKSSGKTYYFPFRLYLKPERRLDESMVKPEFLYVAENLLLRGGYRKTHFHADTITFYNVSTMGEPYNRDVERLEVEGEEFTPKLVFKREYQEIPIKYYIREQILQSLIRNRLRETILEDILNYFSIDNDPEEFEILGEKALPEGYIDIFIKLRHPPGANKYILVEVKTGKASKKDIKQLEKYLQEFKGETAGGVLIAKDYAENIPKYPNILKVKYHFNDIDKDNEYTFPELLGKVCLDLLL